MFEIPHNNAAKTDISLSPSGLLLKLVIPGKPTPKQSMSYNKRRSYTPAKVKQNANNMKAMILSQIKPGFKPFDCPLYVKYHFVFPFLSNTSKRNKQMVEFGGKLYKSTKPDSDNLQKAVNDAMEGIVMINDSQIAKFAGEKRFERNPRIEIEIYEL